MSENLLEGTVKTPIGTFPKKTVVLVGGGIAVLAVIVYFRQKANATDPSLAGAAEINPATGYPFGSAEDAAAMAAQAAYISPGGVGSGGGGGGGTDVPGRFVSNSAWSQYVLTYMMDNDIISDASVLAGALGKYLAGQPVTPAEAGLISQAIAIADKPPLAGPTGYPPSINTQAVVQPPPPTGGGGGNAPTGEARWSVNAGWHVEQWMADVRTHKDGAGNLDGNPNLYWEQLSAWNPGVDGNINWTKDLGSRTFKRAATYRIR